MATPNEWSKIVLLLLLVSFVLGMIFMNWALAQEENKWQMIFLI